MEPQKRVNITMDLSVQREIKKRAIDKGITLNAYFNEIFRKEISTPFIRIVDAEDTSGPADNEKV